MAGPREGMTSRPQAMLSPRQVTGRVGRQVVMEVRRAMVPLVAMGHPGTRVRPVMDHLAGIRGCGTSIPSERGNLVLVLVRDKAQLLDMEPHPGRRSLVVCSGPWTR